VRSAARLLSASARLLKPKELGTAPGMAWDQLPQPEPPKALLDRIETQWGSFAAFKDAFSATATGMSASGWVWLVRDQQGNLGIVPTHGAGTVLVQNRVQKNLGSTFEASVGIDAQGNPLPEAAAQRPQQQGRAASTSPFAAAPARSFSSSSAAASTYASAQRAFGQQPNDSKVGETLQPLLCLSVHEHAWLPDHGFEQDVYLQRFWECVNWTRVANLWDHGEAVYSD
jgi:Fe-Mn family superoxide dismutase